jgi:DNA-binding transcriptional LysR family regulator
VKRAFKMACMPAKSLPVLLPAIAAFARVAHHGSFTHAAAELGVSPSALSQTLRTLEKHLGVRLLDRTTRRVGVTELGRQLLAGAGPGLAAIAESVEGIDEVREKPAGLLRLNVSRTAADILLLPCIADFIEHYPDITLELTCENRLVDLVAEGFDAGLRLGENLTQDVVATPIGSPLRMVTFAAPRYLQGRSLPRTPDDLLAHRCLNFRLSTGGVYRWEFRQERQDGQDRQEEGDRVFDMAVPGPLISNDGDVLLGAARAGAGIAVAFEGAVRADFDSGRLVPVLEPWWPTFPGFYLYHPSRAQIPRKLQVFIEFLKKRHARPPVSQRAVKAPAGSRPGQASASRRPDHPDSERAGGR